MEQGTECAQSNISSDKCLVGPTLNFEGESMNTHPSVVPRPPGEEEKSGRSLLEDIHHRSQFARKPAGIVNPKAVDLATFVASVASVAISAVTLLTMVWNRIDPLLGLKIMASVWVVMLTLLAFRSINRTFAE
jgi:hypothetical protein